MVRAGALAGCEAPAAPPTVILAFEFGALIGADRQPHAAVQAALPFRHVFHAMLLGREFAVWRFSQTLTVSSSARGRRSRTCRPGSVFRRADRQRSARRRAQPVRKLRSASCRM